LIHSYLGAGKYSHVFAAARVKDNRTVAIKILKPTPFWKVRREVAVLRALQGGPHILKLLGACCSDGGIHVSGLTKSAEVGAAEGVGLMGPNTYCLVFDHCGGLVRWPKLPQIGLEGLADANNKDVVPGGADQRTKVVQSPKRRRKQTKRRRVASPGDSPALPSAPPQGWRAFRPKEPPRPLSHGGIPAWRPLRDLEVIIHYTQESPCVLHFPSKPSARRCDGLCISSLRHLHLPTETALVVFLSCTGMLSHRTCCAEAVVTPASR
jgi:hypothetical protein